MVSDLSGQGVQPVKNEDSENWKASKMHSRYEYGLSECASVDTPEAEAHCNKFKTSASIEAANPDLNASDVLVGHYKPFKSREAKISCHMAIQQEKDYDKLHD